MIAYLTGSVLDTKNNAIILLVSGVGYLINSTEDIVRKAVLGASLSLYIHHHIREDSADLYGFATTSELELFELLISVSGVGPKTGLAALSVSSADNIRSAIARGDAGVLKALSGIGPKTAQRIVVELKDKVGFFTTNTKGTVMASQDDGEVVEALIGLGYAPALAREAVASLGLDVNATMQEKIKKALQSLSRSR